LIEKITALKQLVKCTYQSTGIIIVTEVTLKF